MKRGRSTGKPTKEEADWIVAVKEGPCLACWKRDRQWMVGCDAHHLLSGGIRIGHMATIGLCVWHHRGMPEMNGYPSELCRRVLGPSLMDGSKLFREAYGSDEELLELQRRIVRGEEC